MEGLIGKKIGMTGVFDAEGRRIPVTVLECGPCVVVRRKTLEKDGYEAVQLAFEQCPERKLPRPMAGIYKKNGLAPMRHLREFALDPGDEFKPGDTVTAAVFKDVSHVDVSGTTKGRGFQGVMRRHGMSGGPMTHGGKSKRRIGAIGCRELPGHIHKGKRMPGHMGNVKITQQNLKVVEVRPEENVLLVQGAVPGPNGNLVIIHRAVKKGKKG